MWKSVLAGAFTLAVMYQLTTLASGQQNRFDSALQLPAAWAKKLIDPTVALLPDISGGATSTTPPPPDLHLIPSSTTSPPQQNSPQFV